MLATTESWSISLMSESNKVVTAVRAAGKTSDDCALRSEIATVRAQHGISPQTTDAEGAVPANSPLFLHVPGDGQGFRQALVSPAHRVEAAPDTIAPWHSHIVHLLIERANGQLLGLRLLDLREQTLNLKAFMERLEKVLPRNLDDTTDRRALETKIASSLGHEVSLLETTLTADAHSVFGASVASLVTSILRVPSIKRGLAATSDGTKKKTRAANYLMEQLRASMDAFVACLDQRIVAAVVRSGAPLSTIRYNGYRRLSEAKRHYRLQAAEAFPLGGAMLAETRKNSGLRRAVDRQLPLVPAMARVLKTTHEVVRWLMGKDIKHVGLQWAGRIPDLAAHLAVLCPEHRPQTRLDWEAFNALVELALRVGEQNAGEEPLRLASPGVKWVRELGLVGWCKARARLQALGAIPTDLLDIGDLVSEIIEVLALELGASSDVSGVMEEVFFCTGESCIANLFYSSGIFRQLKASLEWHRSFMEPNAAVPVPGQGAPASLDAWPPAFDGVQRFQELSAVCLTNRHQLKAEGVQMKHCVGGYDERCLFKGSSIVSFRDAAGRSLATAELRLEQDAGKHFLFRKAQIKGVRNAVPDKDAEAALEVLVDCLNDASFESRRTWLGDAQKERKALRKKHPTADADPLRVEKLKQALHLHVGWERFYKQACQSCGYRD